MFLTLAQRYPKECRAFANMKRRSYTVATAAEVHPAWLDPHLGFLTFMQDMGPSSGASLCRLDTDKGWTLENTRWVDGQGIAFNARETAIHRHTYFKTRERKQHGSTGQHSAP